MIIKTEFANFNNPQDLYRYMYEENISTATVEASYWGAKLPVVTMTIDEIRNWSEGKDLYGEKII